MLRKARGQIHTLQYSHSERNLPQTAISQNTSDIILSSFPKLIADAAACRVLMYFWSVQSAKYVIMEQDQSYKKPPPHVSARDVSSGGSKENTPHETNSNTNSNELVRFKVTANARYLFETLVVRVWSVFCHPEARQSRLTPQETIEQRFKREMVMRSIMEHLNDTKPIPKLNKQGKPKEMTATSSAKPVIRQKSALTESVDGKPLSATQAVALGASNAADYFDAEDADSMMSVPFDPFKEFLFTG